MSCPAKNKFRRIGYYCRNGNVDLIFRLSVSFFSSFFDTHHYHSSTVDLLDLVAVYVLYIVHMAHATVEVRRFGV